MISIEEMKKLETLLFSENIGCVFKAVYSDKSERVFVEYSGITVLEIQFLDGKYFFVVGKTIIRIGNPTFKKLN